MIVMKSSNHIYVYQQSNLKIMEDHEKTNRTKRLSVFFLVVMSMMFFTYSNSVITGYSTLSTIASGQSFFPIVMGFVSLVGAFLTYFLIERQN